ncbi:hypothetical protein FJ208_01405 [Candidatus Gribaldobacteria bacterium]|nr:hypothetical protein [Candidatus Gribaldobacteria bacterium]
MNQERKNKNWGHTGLTQARWNNFTFFFQMANIASEVGRALKWKNKDKENSLLALWRALELIDLTIIDPKNKKRVWELARAREVLLDYFLANNQYGSTDKNLANYFDIFTFAYLNEQAKGLDKSV